MIFMLCALLAGFTSASVLGWLGTVFYLITYFLLSIRKLKANSILYHFMNLAGAIGMIVHAFFLEDHPNIVVNLVWGGIAVMAMIMILSKKN